MTDYIDPRFVRALCKNPEQRVFQDLHTIYYGLRGLEALCIYRDSSIRLLAKTVRYERHEANDVLYYTGQLSTCWYILLSGSVFIDGSMFLPTNCFGKRTGGSARRANECFVLEASEMIVIDYPEGQNARSNNYNSRYAPVMDRAMNLVFDDSLNNLRSENAALFGSIRSRDSQNSDTSSAYSGSDTMTSVHSAGENDQDQENDMDLDLDGLLESVVDSDEEDVSETEPVKDKVRECLEKDPSDRTEDDVEVLLKFTQHLKAFSNMTLSTRRALCSVMVFAVVEKAGTVVMNDGEELDSWSVLVNGQVQIDYADGRAECLYLGDSFGILPTMEKLYHEGVMKTKVPDCQFVCITQADYYRIQHSDEENIRRHEDENGKLVLVTEQRDCGPADSGRKVFIVIRATIEQLVLQLVKENSSIDPTYIEDFLLTYRIFIKNPIQITTQLMKWFEEDSALRDRVARVVLLWANNHFIDFETNNIMLDFLEKFEECLENENMIGQLRLLHIACAAKARTRNVTLTRSNRDEMLNFKIVGGYERACGIYVSEVDRGSKADEVGLKRGDHILFVNGQSFQHISHVKAMEILCGSTHLSFTVKANLTALKEVLQIPENSPVCRSSSSRLKSVHDMVKHGFNNDIHGKAIIHRTTLYQNPQPAVKMNKNAMSSMTLGPKKKLQKALKKMNILPKNNTVDVTDGDGSGRDSMYHHSHSQPDLISMSYEDYPEHVLKVYKSDQTCKYLLIHGETTAHEVVMLALQEFGITDPSSKFCLCEISVAEGGTIKQKRLQDQLQNLAERIELGSRYYLKTNGITENFVTDELAAEMAKEGNVHFLQLSAIQVAIQLTLQDFEIFKSIEGTEYVDDLFELKSAYGTPSLQQFSQLVNKEMFWVVTEICSELNLVKRSKLIKHFIKVARICKECKNFNSMFSIISGLGHASVSRLRQTWEKVNTKYNKMFDELQNLMDPSRNMSKYRQLISEAVQTNPPVIPFYPIVKKDFTFIDLGNDTWMDGLVNFEKCRMVAKEVRCLANMCSSNYNVSSMFDSDVQTAAIPNACATGNSNQSHHPVPMHGLMTVKRRKKSSGMPNAKKMFEEAQMVRRVKAYLSKMKVIDDEEQIYKLSLACEGSAVSSVGPVRKRHPSPTLSTTSSTSSTSEGRKATAPKFGSASPQAVRKLLSLSEQSKTRPHQPRHHSPSPSMHRHVHQAGGLMRAPASVPALAVVTSHERSHSDTTTASGHAHYQPPPCVRLNAESSSVTSLSNLPLRKGINSVGSLTSNDSGNSTSFDSHSNSSAETNTAGAASPRMMHHRRHSIMQMPQLPHSGGFNISNGRARQPASYNASVIHHVGLNRAHSHEAVGSNIFYPHPPVNQHEDEDDTQVSAV